MAKIPAGLLVLCCVLHALAQTQSRVRLSNTTHSPKRPVTVADGIEMTQIGDRTYLDDFAKTGNVVQFSPDRKKFAFVVQKGNLSKDTVDYSIIIFRTADAFTAPHGQVVATLSSSSNRPAISQVTWLGDDDTLVFLGEEPGETPQLYKVSCATKRLQRLTNESRSVVGYSMSHDAGTFVYLVQAVPDRPISKKMLERGFAVTSQDWEDIYRNEAKSQDFRKEIFLKTPDLPVAKSLGIVETYDEAYVHGLSVSPDGRYALIAAFDTAPPQLWSDYKLSFKMPEYAASCTSGEAYRCPSRYLLMDLKALTIKPLLDTPIVVANGGRGGMGVFSWTRESSLLLVNTLLSLDSVQESEREKRRRTVYTVELTLPEKKIVKITERDIPFPAFYMQPEVALDRFVTQPLMEVDGSQEEFTKNGSSWNVRQLSSKQMQESKQILVTLVQDMNSPPKLEAIDPQTGKRAVQLNLNPQFSQLTFGHVETFSWKTADGRTLEGSLYYPPDYVEGRRYPLVIQTHGYSRDRFWIDGPFSTSFAAQALANRGFLVLQMQLGDTYNKQSLDEVASVLDTPKEGPYFAAFFVSALKELDHRGMVDPSRVGLTGFSRTVYHVLYELTHSDLRFGAAVAADGVDFGYTGCLFYLAQSASTASLCEKMNGGGPPYGDALAGWAKDAPSFNLDKIHAPLLLQAITAPLSEWELFVGLRWLGKPVEMLNFYPQGEHMLVRPGQRMMSQQTVVDWYCFWLKGEEDPDPAKVNQYDRWRKMRDHQRDSASATASRR
jgi:dipeptidyl aminopeptidase/acylaminoacyl peptidase